MNEDPHLVRTCVFLHARSPDKGEKEECGGLEHHQVGCRSGVAVPAHHLVQDINPIVKHLLDIFLEIYLLGF